MKALIELKVTTNCKENLRNQSIMKDAQQHSLIIFSVVAVTVYLQSYRLFLFFQ